MRLTSYQCPSGVLTIGYGHTGPDVRDGEAITVQKADELFNSDITGVEDWLSHLLAENQVSLTQGQFDALVSFIFNCGRDKFRRSTMWRKIKANPTNPSIANEFRRWVYSGSVKLRGLETRRNAEVKFYFTDAV